jgi:hypothetical protein
MHVEQELLDQCNVLNSLASRKYICCITSALACTAPLALTLLLLLQLKHLQPTTQSSTLQQ